jgi:hypothetical protein
VTKPITPKEVRETATKPDVVIEVFNELIQKYWDGDQAVIKESEAAQLISKRMDNIGTKAIYENRWLDIEHLYQKSGWVVVYDKPGFNESYPATFTFSTKK